MISPDEESMINKLAYVPEHIVSLMKIISGGEPFFEDGFLYFKGSYWVILIGYPLFRVYTEERILAKVSHITGRFDFDYLWLIAPRLPDRLRSEASVFTRDHYYTLNLDSFNPPQRVIKQVEKASQVLRVKISRKYTAEHENLSRIFIKEKKPDPFVKGLYESMGLYLAESQSALLIEAWNADDRLVAFYVIETAAEDFLTYLAGCRETDTANYRASDLIFMKMIEVAREMKKKYIHLGLGVNEGIARFKKKWGGVPSMPYEFAELRKKKSFLNIIDRMSRIL